MSKASAERMRRLRRRQRDGIVVIPVEIHPAVVDAMLEFDIVSDAASGDRKQLAAAASGVLLDWQKWRRSNQ